MRPLAVRPALLALAALPGLLAIAACPKASDSTSRPPEPPGRRDDAQLSRPGPDDTTSIVLPPAPALPVPPASLPPPPANPRVTPESVAFGELLFHDPRLSADGTRACATCHDPARGYAGAMETSASGKPNARRTPTLVNLAWVRELGWDGRAPSLAAHLPGHLAGQLDALEASSARIASVPAYRAHIARVGGTAPEAIVQALEAFVWTRYEGDAPWDALERTVRAAPDTAPSDPVLAGYRLFTGKARCASCHTPPLYTDGGYHRVYSGGVREPARGLVDPALDGAYRTPTLRGASQRPAFFHGGGAASLEAAVDHYIRLGQSVTDSPPFLDRLVFDNPISPAERTQLLAFIRALTTGRPAPTKPLLP